MKRQRYLALALATGAVVALAVILQALGGPHARMLQAGEPIPDFSAPRLSGGWVSWSDYAGSPTVLAVWAPWCPHCRRELPVLARVAKDFPNVKFLTVVTAIGQEPGPSPEQYLRDNRLSFTVAVDDSKQTLLRSLGVQYFPTVYYVGSDGKVVQATTGEIDEATLRSLFASL